MTHAANGRCQLKSSQGDPFALEVSSSTYKKEIDHTIAEIAADISDREEWLTPLSSTSFRAPLGASPIFRDSVLSRNYLPAPGGLDQARRKPASKSFPVTATGKDVYAFSMPSRELRMLNKKWAEILEKDYSLFHFNSLDASTPSTKYMVPALSEPTLEAYNVTSTPNSSKYPLPTMDSGFESSRSSGTIPSVLRESTSDDGTVETAIQQESTPSALTRYDINLDPINYPLKSSFEFDDDELVPVHLEAFESPSPRRRGLWLQNASSHLKKLFTGVVTKRRGQQTDRAEAVSADLNLGAKPAVDKSRRLLAYLRRIGIFFLKLKLRRKHGCA
ncbi:hypothetical protein HDU67_000517 [Dinochytrium kinnereticum]|nr:hypothetical protein HDU67_000517 [Dinochytrium kinnereticum]